MALKVQLNYGTVVDLLFYMQVKASDTWFDFHPIILWLYTCKQYIDTVIAKLGIYICI